MHYVLIGGVVFPIFAAVHHWLPKITGRLLSDRLGSWSFWLTFTGFNVTFFPMHLMGLLGLPRRVYTYPAELGLDGMNMSASIGAFVMGAGMVLILVNVVRSLRHGPAAGDDPWRGETLEWSVSSPPPVFSFRRPPLVHGRSPLWRGSSAKQPDAAGSERVVAAMDSAPTTWRATLTTDPVTAAPQGVQPLPGPSLLPLLAALGLLVAMLGVLSHLYLLAPLGAVFMIGALVRWLYPRSDRLERIKADEVGANSGLPVFALGVRSTAWWGMLSLTTVLGMVLGTLVFCYFYLRLFSEQWPQEGLPLPGFMLAVPAFTLLVLAALAAHFAWRTARDGRGAPVLGWLAASVGGGVGFLVLTTMELAGLEFGPQVNAYASVFYVTVWLLYTIVLTACVLAAAAWWWLRNRAQPFDTFDLLQLQLARMFWVFTAGAGLVGFLVIYASPHLL